MIDLLENELRSHEHFNYTANENLAKYSTLRLKSFGHVLKVSSVEILSKVLNYLNREQVQYRIIGFGSNQVLSGSDTLLYLKIDLPYSLSDVSTLSSEYHLPATFPLYHLTTLAMKYFLDGFEVFTGIPATLGGAVYMNAGTSLGEIGSIVKKVHLLTKEGKFKEIVIEKGREKDFFNYRKNLFCFPGEVITHVTIAPKGENPNIAEKIRHYQKYRNETQPLQQKTCGCVFKNPNLNVTAGQLIDQCGLKGLNIGGVRVSPMHANFIENVADGTYQDFIQLVEQVKERVFEKFNIKLELEVQI